MMESSGVDEFREILSLLSPEFPMFAISGRVLYRRDNPRRVEIRSLTPSDQAFAAAQQVIARLLPRPLAPKTRIGPEGPHHASVVLWILVGSSSLLLGSDLQEKPGNHWTAVLGSSNKPDGKANVFKIPHHGSSNADHPGVWDELVQPGALALLSPFHLGSVTLPTPADRARICLRNAETYITAPPQRPRPRRRDRAVERTLGEVVEWIRPANGPAGHVRARTKIAAGARWEVRTFGPAEKLCA